MRKKREHDDPGGLSEPVPYVCMYHDPSIRVLIDVLAGLSELSYPRKTALAFRITSFSFLRTRRLKIHR